MQLELLQECLSWSHKKIGRRVSSDLRAVLGSSANAAHIRPSVLLLSFRTVFEFPCTLSSSNTKCACRSSLISPYRENYMRHPPRVITFDDPYTALLSLPFCNTTNIKCVLSVIDLGGRGQSTVKSSSSAVHGAAFWRERDKKRQNQYLHNDQTHKWAGGLCM